MSDIVLEKIKFAVERRIPAGGTFERTITVETDRHIGFVADQLLVRLSATVLGLLIAEPHVEYPATWWDACKQRWFPLWLRRRFPVRMTTVDFKVYHMFPNLALPKQEHVLHYSTPMYDTRSEGA